MWLRFVAVVADPHAVTVPEGTNGPPETGRLSELVQTTFGSAAPVHSAAYSVKCGMLVSASILTMYFDGDEYPGLKLAHKDFVKI